MTNTEGILLCEAAYWRAKHRHDNPQVGFEPMQMFVEQYIRKLVADHDMDVSHGEFREVMHRVSQVLRGEGIT